ncbi:hypothetical protein GCM10010305_61110 [Streptomyces termitum]|uniref:Transposase n=1 Tax=Streptomyces termitum TaxID=67368 RepID=A0A918T8K4_9ACTN|nr:hypothetical protein GCM10010305_61110 [Streptomyces termitum]
MRWPGGSRQCGRARKTRGGPWSLARLRGRSRILHDTAAGQDLNPAEGIWSLLWPGWLSNIAFPTPERLAQRIRRGLRHIQYRSDLIDDCLTETGPTIRPP